jgi:hypothetical protein
MELLEQVLQQLDYALQEILEQYNEMVHGHGYVMVIMAELMLHANHINKHK